MSARIKPHKVRGRQLEEVREKDPEGRIVVHHRTVDTLGRMLRSGTISQAMPRHRCSADFMLLRGSPVASTRESSRAAIRSKEAVLGASRSGGSQSATASTTTLASCRSGVSKPSVNQAWIGARRSCAWRRLPCSAHRRASEVAARSSKPLAC
jgi:hypothetical protein